jgi:CelD/BcsL family acetyltransferase involved in cellulose biosynthesis
MSCSHAVDRIDNLTQLGAIEATWEGIYDADTEATVFTSWAWVQGRLAALEEPWCVLLARSASGLVEGLLPLCWRLAAEDQEILAMAGSPLADYTSFLCTPGREEAVLAAFAGYVQDHLEWQKFEIRDLLDRRLALFLSGFHTSHFRIEKRPPTPCPRIDLSPFLDAENSWEAYLLSRPRPRLRREIRHDLRVIERLPGLRRTSVEDDGELQIAILLKLWQERWGKLAEPKLAEYLSVFRTCLAAECLWLDLLWDGDIPISGLLAFLDHKKRSFGFYITGYNKDYATLSPGTVIIAHSLREALRQRYKVFDFLRGDEPYKFSFGAEPRHTENLTIHRGPGERRQYEGLHRYV